MDVKELRTELNKRELDVRDKPRVLRKCLNLVICQQKEERLQEEAAVEQQHMHEVFQEAAESESVYSVGWNNLGQLDLHDKKRPSQVHAREGPVGWQCRQNICRRLRSVVCNQL